MCNWEEFACRCCFKGLSPEQVFCPKLGLTFAPTFHALSPLSGLCSAFLLMLLPAITFPFTTWNKTKQPSLPKAPGFTSRYPSLFPFLCRVSLQLHGECGFPLKFPCCLALYWLSPIVVYHQQIWQVHSWFLHCSSCCWVTKRGIIEPSPSTYLLTCSYSLYSQKFFLEAVSSTVLVTSPPKQLGEETSIQWSLPLQPSNPIFCAHTLTCTPVHSNSWIGQENFPLVWPCL